MEVKGILKILLVVLSLIPFAVVTSKALTAGRLAEETNLQKDRESARKYNWYAVGTLLGTVLLLLLSRWYFTGRELGEDTDDAFLRDGDVGNNAMSSLGEPRSRSRGSEPLSMPEMEPFEESMDYFEPGDY
jgi:hypothetical protein